MEYVPYEINAESTRIKLYQNEFHGLKTFSNVKAGKEFLRERAVDVVKYEESGRNAENCVFTETQIVDDVSSVKDGLFVKEIEDGYVLQNKEYSYSWSMYPTITDVKHFMLASLTRPASTTTSTSTYTSNQPQRDRQLVIELENAFSEGIKLKKTGLLSELTKPSQSEMEEVEETASDDFEDFDDPLPALPPRDPPQRELPPLPTDPKPIKIEDIEDILFKAAINEINEHVDYVSYEDLPSLEEEYLPIYEEEKEEKTHNHMLFSEFESGTESESSEEDDTSDTEYSSTSSEIDREMWTCSEESDDYEHMTIKYSL